MVNVVILQGDRDPFGSKSDVAAYELSEAVQIHWLPDGEHSFTPRKASAGRSGRIGRRAWRRW